MEKLKEYLDTGSEEEEAAKRYVEQLRELLTHDCNRGKKEGMVVGFCCYVIMLLKFPRLSLANLELLLSMSYRYKLTNRQLLLYIPNAKYSLAARRPQLLRSIVNADFKSAENLAFNIARNRI